ncbi:MAG: membrane protein insertase YidC [Anaerolineales bacterium]|nr:MAG: membrane protein insertase YidC [Anaerolineales bacterium]
MWNSFILEPAINALIFIYNVLGQNFGLAIIVFTALVRLLTLPLTYQQMRSSMVMAEIQKSDRFLKMKEKYKNDRQKMSEEQMKLFREVGHNPFSGCLGMLIQFPIIIGLYQAVIRSLAATPVQLFDLSKFIYAAIPANLIPLNTQFLWMANLGQPERLPLVFLQGTSLAFLQYQIPVLTILVVISTYLQTKLTTPAGADQQGAQMSQMMSLYMPLLLGYFAYTLASGLALYFVTSNLLGIVQGLVMRRARQTNANPVGGLPSVKKKKQPEKFPADKKKR